MADRTSKQRQNITNHNINRHCRARYNAFVQQSFSKQLYFFQIETIKRSLLSRTGKIDPNLLLTHRMFELQMTQPRKFVSYY